MKAFETTGRFWLPDKPDQDVAGTLTFHPADGCSLSLIGSLIGPRGGRDDRVHRIHGVTSKHQVNLEGCFLTSWRHRMPGGMEETWHVAAVLQGVFIEDDDDLVFDGATFEIEGLFEWTGRRGTTVELVEDSGNVLGVKISHRATLPESHGSVDDRRVVLEFPWATTGDRERETGVAARACVTVRWPSPEPLDRVLGVLKAFQDLMTLAAGTGCAPLAVSLYHPDVILERPTTAPNRQIPITYFGSSIAASRGTRQQLQRRELRFTMDDLGGSLALLRWLELSDVYGRAIDSLVTMRYQPSMYSENRFLNAVASAETFHRERFPGVAIEAATYRRIRDGMLTMVPEEHQELIKARLAHANEPFLKMRLSSLVVQGIGSIDSPLADARWPQVVTSVRNKLVHPSAGAQRVDGSDLVWLAESVLVVMTTCLLREISDASGLVERYLDHRHTRHWLEGLPEILDRLTPATGVRGE
jgi:hypothetical protein